MRETLDYMVWRWKGLRGGGWKSMLPAGVALALVFGVYLATLHIPPGMVTWAALAPAAVVVTLTSLSRLNAMEQDLVGWKWQVRRAGLIMAGAGSAMMLSSPLAGMPIYPTWRGVLILWGVACVWSTTPLSKFTDAPIPGRPRSPLERVVGWVQRRGGV